MKVVVSGGWTVGACVNFAEAHSEEFVSGDVCSVEDFILDQLEFGVNRHREGVIAYGLPVDICRNVANVCGPFICGDRCCLVYGGQYFINLG